MTERGRMKKQPSRLRYLPLASGVTSLILGVGVLAAPAFAEKLPEIPDISKPISILQDHANDVPQPKENLPAIPVRKHHDDIPDPKKQLWNFKQNEQKPQVKQPEEKPDTPSSVQNSEPIDQPSKPKLDNADEKQSTPQPQQEPPQLQQSEQVQPQPNPAPQLQDSQEQKSVPQPVPEAPQLKELKKSANQPEKRNPQSARKDQDVVPEQPLISAPASKPATTPIKKPSPQVATNTEVAVNSGNTTTQNQVAEPVQKTKDGIQLPKTATPYPNMALSGVLFIFGGAMLDLYRRMREHEA